MPLTSFADEIWIAEGSNLSVLGFSYPTRCAVIRLTDGRLLVWSPIALTAALRTAVDALGPVSHLIAPNHFHHMFLADWVAAYPTAQLHGLPGLAKKRTDLTFHHMLGSRPDPAWADVMAQVRVDNRLTPEVVFFHKPSGTVIFTDLIQQFPKGWHTGWRSVVARLDKMVGTQPNVPRKFRLGFSNRKRAREQIGQVLSWPAQHVLMAHGTPVQSGGKAVLAHVFSWLIKP